MGKNSPIRLSKSNYEKVLQVIDGITDESGDPITVAKFVNYTLGKVLEEFE